MTNAARLEHGKLYKLSDMILYCEIEDGVVLLFQWVGDKGKPPLNAVALSVEQNGDLHYLEPLPPPEMADWSQEKAREYVRRSVERSVQEPRPSGYTVRDLVPTGESAV